LILSVLSSVFGAAASWRRRWYARDPSRQRRLTKTVVSVGNLRVGGTGKTPAVAHLCELLLSHGERPSILTRGYGRTRPSDAVTVVSNGKEIVADLGSAGDEPLMLARLLPSVPVLVGTDRFECGRRAERDFDVTVHVLDDGFQHLTLARDVDLLLVDEQDLNDRVLPAGRLREPLTNASAAHALLVTADDAGSVMHIAHSLGVAVAFHVLRAIHTPRWLGRETVAHAIGDRVLAFAGIARPERFFSDLAASGRSVVEKMTFADHHPFTQQDVDSIVERARALQTPYAVTTEKDAVRLEGLDFKGLPVQTIPLSVTIEPALQFHQWLFDRLSMARSRRPHSDTPHPARQNPHHS
jgi:tetraacyldisaccharide 4'-kinase